MKRENWTGLRIEYADMKESFLSLAEFDFQQVIGSDNDYFDFAYGFLKIRPYNEPGQYIVGMGMRQGRMYWLGSSIARKLVAIIPVSSKNTYKLIFFSPSNPVTWVEHELGNIRRISSYGRYVKPTEVQIVTVLIYPDYKSLGGTTNVINIDNDVESPDSISDVNTGDIEHIPNGIEIHNNRAEKTNSVPTWLIVVGIISGCLISIVIFFVIKSILFNRRNKNLHLETEVTSEVT